MGLHYETGDRVIRFVFEGATPARDIYATFHRAFSQVTSEHEVVIDLRASTSLADRTPEFVRMLTEFVIEHPDRPGSRIAVLVPATEIPRWQKLTEGFNASGKAKVELFQESDDAEAWAEG